MRRIVILAAGLAACAQPALDSAGLPIEEADFEVIDPIDPADCLEFEPTPALWFPLEGETNGLTEELVLAADGVFAGTGTPTFAPGSVGNGATFGPDRWVEGPELPLLDVPGDVFTFATWVRFDGQFDGAIASRGWAGSPGSWALRAVLAADGLGADVEFEVCDAQACQTVTLGGALPVGERTLVAVTMQPGFNGTWQPEVTAVPHPSSFNQATGAAGLLTMAPGFDLDASGPLALGAVLDQVLIQPGPIDAVVAVEHFDGLLDEAMFWPGAIGWNDLQAIANAGPAGLCSDCLNDTTPPVISCPAPVNVPAGDVFVPAPATATDDCDDNPLLSMSSFPNPAPSSGTVDVTYYATDASGNTSSCTVSNPVSIPTAILDCSMIQPTPQVIRPNEAVALQGTWSSTCSSATCEWFVQFWSDRNGTDPLAGGPQATPITVNATTFDIDLAGAHQVSMTVKEYRRSDGALLDTCTTSTYTVSVDQTLVPAGPLCGRPGTDWQYEVDQGWVNFVNGPALGTATLTGAQYLPNLIIGNDLDNVIDGDDYDDCIYGGRGDDRIHGDSGQDEIHGESGEDRLWGDYGHDTIYGGSGDDRIWGDQHNDVLYGGTGEDRIRGGSGNDEIHGEADNDDIDGDSGNDDISGGPGSDELDGSGGSDTIDGGAWGQLYDPNDAGDDIDGGSNDDWLYGAAGDDTIDGSSGDDTIDGGQDDDTIDAGSGDDWAHGSTGNDTLFGGGGGDWLYAGSGAWNKLRGEGGNDRLEGGSGEDFLDGGSNNDDLIGHGGDDRLCGGSGNPDEAWCGAGQDILVSGTERDNACEGVTNSNNNSLCGNNAWNNWP